jgi:hypothetical protein
MKLNEIQSYDRFQRDDELIEATGLWARANIGETDLWTPVFRIINGGPGIRVNEIQFFTQEAWENSGFKKINSSLTHPLVTKVAEALINEPELITQFINLMSIWAKKANDKECFGFIALLREHLPDKVKKGIRPGELCEYCEVRY